MVKFFNGEPKKGNQIGSDRVINRLLPLEFKNVSVEWNITKLKGLQRIYVQVFPSKNVIQALGPRAPLEVVTDIDLDVYRSCMSKR